MRTKNNLSVVIPALIKDKHDEQLLKKTLKKVSLVSDDLIVISQGNKPNIKNNNLKIFHSNIRMGKWKALSLVKDLQLKDDVFIHDADDPFDGFSYLERSIFKSNSLITRNKISLFASDQISENSRMFVELFINKYIYKNENDFPDIQSGSFILNKEIFKTFEFEKFDDYGGELKIFTHLKKNKVPLNFINMMIQDGGARKKSNYSIDFILKQVITEPISETNVYEIIDMCFNGYKKHIKSKVKFKREIIFFLNRNKLIA